MIASAMFFTNISFLILYSLISTACIAACPLSPTNKIFFNRFRVAHFCILLLLAFGLIDRFLFKFKPIEDTLQFLFILVSFFNFFSPYFEILSKNKIIKYFSYSIIMIVGLKTIIEIVKENIKGLP